MSDEYLKATKSCPLKSEVRLGHRVNYSLILQIVLNVKPIKKKVFSSILKYFQ